MSFREKSAWVMAVLMSLAGLYYLNLAVGASRALGAPAPPVGIFIAYVILVVIASVAAQVGLALSAPKEANAPADERERPLLQRAGNWSGIVLGAGTATALLYYLQHGNGDLLFHMVMGSLIVSQIAEYGFQIALLRRSA
ncbi:MAG: hypothetical protein QOJ27_1119 [Sphingomonadales bacterium]|jgi:hypothetical protein|nr:hypothetical protein [Sphingomonadales bacterium]